MDLIGGRWKSRIICVLADGPLRYSELRAEPVDITDTALASVLKDLTGNQLVARRQYEGIPPRVEYELTKKGRSLVPFLQALCKWSGIFYRDVKNDALRKCQKYDFHG